MQTINLDNSIKTTIPTLYFKQKNVGSEFTARLFENSTALNVAGNSFSVWYSGESGDGNYSTINGETAFFVNGNEVRVEMIAQMVNSPGEHEMCLIMNDSEGNQIGFWNIPYCVEAIPGAASEEATQYFNELAGAAEDAKAASEAAKGAAEDAQAAQVAAGLWAAAAERAADSVSNPVSYKPQTLTEEEKAQARANIGAIGVDDVVMEASGDALSAQYDLKAGYGYTEDMYIGEDGTDTELTAYDFFRTTDFIPVKNKTEYTMLCVVYTLYDENQQFVSSGNYTDGFVNEYQTFTTNFPKKEEKEQDGYVKLMLRIDLKCVDFVPVKAGTSYTMYGCGYALYNAQKEFLTAKIDKNWVNAKIQFTPSSDGFVRLTINSDDITYARFCRTSEENRKVWEYEIGESPFVDPRLSGNVFWYGDSNSYGEGLADKSKSWANRIGALVEDLPETYQHYRLSGFADKKKGELAMSFPSINASASLTAYTKSFTLYADPKDFVGLFLVFDGDTEHPEAMMPDGAGTEYVEITVQNKTSRWYKYTHTFDTEGMHDLIIIGGYYGTNKLNYVETTKTYKFENYATSGWSSASLYAPPDSDDGGIGDLSDEYKEKLLNIPARSINVAMFGGNDRGFPCGATHECIMDFYRRCVAVDAVPIIITPAPIQDESGMNVEMPSYITAQLPCDCINIYGDLQLLEKLSGEELYLSDHLHLSERGHELLYSIAAAKLNLAVPNSDIKKSSVFGDIEAALAGIIAIQNRYINGGGNV